jgi:uncharacterized damage-inducible protein DinB
MTYYGAKEMAESFRTVRNNTILTAEDIPEDQYNFQATPDTGSVARRLAHIAVAFTFQHQIHAVEARTTLEGIDFPSLMQRLKAEEEQPRSKEESEEFLAERVGMPHGGPPPDKSRLEMILSVKEHEMHHRGQLMLIQRMLGIVPHLTRNMQARMAEMQDTAKA